MKASSRGRAIVPAERTRYLAEIADSLRGYHTHTAEQARIARERQALRATALGLAPQWYPALRRPLTLVVSISLLLAWASLLRA